MENEARQTQIAKKTSFNHRGDSAGECPTKGGRVRSIFYVLDWRQPAFLQEARLPHRNCASAKHELMGSAGQKANQRSLQR